MEPKDAAVVKERSVVSRESAQGDAPTSQEKTFVERGRQVRAALLAASPEAAADETLLVDLVARQVPIYSALEEAQLQLALRLTMSANAPTAALALARVMKEITHLSGAIQKRIEGSLATAAGLRAQRRFLSLRGAR